MFLGVCRLIVQIMLFGFDQGLNFFFTEILLARLTEAFFAATGVRVLADAALAIFFLIHCRRLSKGKEEEETLSTIQTRS
jgi:hypothetical protein